MKRYTRQTTITVSDDVTTAYSGLLTSFNTLNLIEALLANGYKWCFSDGFMLKIYLSSLSGIPKCLTCIVIIAMFGELKLPSTKMVADVPCRVTLGCNRRVESQICYVEFGCISILQVLKLYLSVNKILKFELFYPHAKFEKQLQLLSKCSIK